MPCLYRCFAPLRTVDTHTACNGEGETSDLRAGGERRTSARARWTPYDG